MRKVVIVGIILISCFTLPIMGMSWGESEKFNEETLFTHLDKQVDRLARVVQAIYDNPFQSANDRLLFVRHSMEKEDFTSRMAAFLTKQFLQRRLSLDDPQRGAKLEAIHHILVALADIEDGGDPKTSEKLRHSVMVLKGFYNQPLQAELSSSALSSCAVAAAAEASCVSSPYAAGFFAIAGPASSMILASAEVVLGTPWEHQANAFCSVILDFYPTEGSKE